VLGWDLEPPALGVGGAGAGPVVNRRAPFGQAFTAGLGLGRNFGRGGAALGGQVEEGGATGFAGAGSHSRGAWETNVRVGSGQRGPSFVAGRGKKLETVAARLPWGRPGTRIGRGR